MPRYKPDTGNMPELLTTRQVSAWLNIPASELYRTGTERVPGRITLSKKTVRWDRAVLLKWIEDSRAKPEANGDRQGA